ncbi:hypothetical protein C8R48DRAFT_743455, partial [Suillus tomentosus]
MVVHPPPWSSLAPLWFLLGPGPSWFLPGPPWSLLVLPGPPWFFLVVSLFFF